MTEQVQPLAGSTTAGLDSAPTFEITDLPGVFGSGLHCGIKAVDTKGKRDLAYLFVPHATACAAVLTKNIFCAACIDHTRTCLGQGTIKAIVVNSGNANAATGPTGRIHVQQTAETAARMLGLHPEEVAVASTGIIGVQLPIEKLLTGLSTLLAEPKVKQGDFVSQAILTTDLVSKKVALVRSIGSPGKPQTTVRIAGMAKGSGMIAPNMATMLGYLAIDAAIPQDLLQQMFSRATEQSFNMVSVDTDTSTSDMALLFSTGDVEIELTPETIQQLQQLIVDASVDLAKQIARDGEGAQKLIEVSVVGAASESDARRIARNVIDSPLVKTAIHGADPNWGRVMMALGKDPNVRVEPDKVEIRFGSHLIFANGQPLAFSKPELVELLKQKTVQIYIDLRLTTGDGTGTATAWGCDLTKGYIDINTAYN